MEQQGRPLVLQQHLAARIAGLVMLPIAGLPLAVVLVQGWLSTAVILGSLAWAALFATIGIRNWRGAVFLTDDAIVIRGQLWSRRIERPAVVGVTEYSWLTWRATAGATRYSPLILFWDPGSSYPQFMAHSNRCLEVIRLWCEGVSVDDLREAE